MDWKVAGELHMPKNITVGSKSPLFVLKVLKDVRTRMPNARKTDGTDGSELWNTLEEMEHGKEAEMRNV